MYCGDNRTALRSREWLKDALLELLKEERYEKITVKDICRKADLSRQTYYQIFDSKDEILEYHFSALFSKFQNKCEDFKGISLKRLTCMFFEFFKENKPFIEVLITNNMTYLMENQFEFFLPRIDMFREINEKETFPDYSVAYLSAPLHKCWFIGIKKT